MAWAALLRWWTPAACTCPPWWAPSSSRDLPEFKWVNTVLGNLKMTLAGAVHSLIYRKYAGHYLAAFACRFNQRFDLRGLVARLIVDVALGKPAKETVVRSHAEAGC